MPAASLEGHVVVTNLCYVILPGQNLGCVSHDAEFCGQISKSSTSVRSRLKAPRRQNAQLPPALCSLLSLPFGAVRHSALHCAVGTFPSV